RFEAKSWGNMDRCFRESLTDSIARVKGLTPKEATQPPQDEDFEHVEPSLEVAKTRAKCLRVYSAAGRAEDYRMQSNKESAALSEDSSSDLRSPAASQSEASTSYVADSSGVEYPLWSTTYTELGQLGMGIGMYFQIMEMLVGLSAIWTTSALTLLYTCLHFAFNCSSGEEFLISGVSRTSFASILVNNHFETLEGSIPSCAGLSSWKIIFCISCFDTIAALVFFIGVMWLRHTKRQEQQRMDKESITCRDYSVWVRGLPHNVAHENEIRQHFEHYGQLAQVHIVRSVGKLLSCRKRYTKILQALRENSATLFLSKGQCGARYAMHPPLLFLLVTEALRSYLAFVTAVQVHHFTPGARIHLSIKAGRLQ
ncbi:hypothetical protein CYMTET_36216, partial [Cymbomonas tetramitiformis]